ncbi:hydrogenase nickel incorporation protein HypA [Actinobacillus succinogenes]|uniref:Hydrogenase maturation factor HypA n=1 Tax=Actinobacillus succinogenes (strain ATCC 55618 / DSM 22257 / CCUG 43843 / 130Z) TaxID=339671 RepID=HYPA_ACTSZ|nr:hydrogenase maturation nickel metallochaperone HypA [Actinobacillus succinogenes]A6VPH7.1 RecName: Full=Hydrogenase maturation factor HypA [Actinobacillus succinogenes 130Z]ABR74874.1 hydrogenase nickel insertion protein HypA [Actinobacillus succinogenes 130Z]PHI40716.1 hydrogenase nickel incorporation protein HypA [Actinobacillus succinogenes]
MHEMALTQNIIEIVEEQCRRNHVNKVTDIWLEIGPLSCVEPDAITFCFDVYSKDTVMENCKIHFIPVPALAYCWHCEKTVKIKTHHDACPECGGVHLQKQGGDELRIKEIAVE